MHCRFGIQRGWRKRRRRTKRASPRVRVYYYEQVQADDGLEDEMPEEEQVALALARSYEDFTVG